jgi:hypothetical protein
MLVNFTDDVDLTSRGKRVAAIGLSQGTGANTVRIRRGSLTGSVVWEIQLAATSSKELSFNAPLYVQEGVFVEVSGTGLNVGAIDLI